MAQITVAQRKEMILKLLKDNTIVKTIVLVGESGVGKTWTAREISVLAIKKDLFNIALWVFLNREYNDDMLRECVARQLCLLPTIEEWEHEDEKGDSEKEESQKDLKTKEEKQKELEEKISETLKGKKLLLVLDDVDNKMKEDQIIPKLKTLLNLNDQGSYVTIMTRQKSIQSRNATEPVEGEGETDLEVESLPKEDKTRKEVEVGPMSIEESMSLLRARAGTKVDSEPGIIDLAESFLEKTVRLPAAIIMLAKALTYFGKQDSGLWKLRSALEETFDNDSDRYNLSQLIRSGYDKLPHSVLIDFCSSGSHFFRDRGSVHYNELITYWILEGFVGTCTNSVEEAYEEGHRVLMELMDCQMLKKVEAGYVIMDGSPLNYDESQLFGLDQTAILGLASVFDDKWEGLGGVTQMDGMVKTLFCGKEEQKLTTLLLDGKRLSREVTNKFFESQQELQVLSIFHPNFTSFPKPFYTMKKLQALVLRGCNFLQNLDQFKEVNALTVLEISGASSLKTLPDDLFQQMPKLRSLNLSELEIDQLPKSLYDLKELCWLILRGCSRLGSLKSLKKLTKLTVLDLSGAICLKTILDKSFKENPKLQTLNFSQTQIKNLPKLLNHGELTFLSLRDCRELDRLPSIQALATIQTLDLSGAKKFKEFHEQSLESNVRLKILDLSETAINPLPSNISPCHLFLRRCSVLIKLPRTEALKDLEVLDLSGTRSLEEIDSNFFENLRSLRILNLSETSIKSLPSISNLCKLHLLNLSGCSALKALYDQSFDHMSRLQKLDLSGTIIESVPSLSNLSNLRCLLLEKCSTVKEAPQLESLSKIEELNLCGMSSLRGTGADFLKSMSNLEILNLSKTNLEELPSMSSLKNLKQLFLSGCSDLKTVPDLHMLTKLEVLDLSETAVTSLCSLENFTLLRRLFLRDCFSLEDFVNLKILGVLGATSTELPYGISKLTHLEHLDLPNVKNIEGADSEKVDQNQWGISSFSTDTLRETHRSIRGTTFFQLLKRSQSWESLEQFHFCIHPTEGENGEWNRGFYRNELIFRDVHFKTREFAHFKDQRSLDIHGFHDLPKGIEDILSHADCVFLFDNTFETWLSGLGASNLKVMKGCWIERCTNMESLFHEKEAEDIAKLQTTLETLGVSNAINLKSIYSGNKQIDVFRNLKSLYLDCCPNLSTLFSSSPPENLKVLQIKFCDKLETLFEQSSSEHRLPNLQTLHLWDLPELKSIGCPLPSVQSLKVSDCPNLRKLEENIKSAESLQVLWVSNVSDLKSIYSGNLQPESLNNLKSLTLESCPELINVFSSPGQPMNLETLQIKCCGKLETVFEHGRSEDIKLSSLHTLHLQELPKLKKIGAQMPSPQNRVLIECSNC